MRLGGLNALQIQQALQEWTIRRQRSSRASFGQVVLGQGLCSAAALMPCLALQRKLATAPGGNRPLGTLLVEQGLMKPSDVVAALAHLAASGQRLGELLRAEGALRQPQIDMVLMMQRRAAYGLVQSLPSLFLCRAPLGPRRWTGPYGVLLTKSAS